MSHWQYLIKHMYYTFFQTSLCYLKHMRTCILSVVVLSLSQVPPLATPILNKSTPSFLVPSVCPRNVSDDHRLTVYFYIKEAWAYLPNTGFLNVGLVFQLPGRNIHSCLTHSSVQLARNKMYLFCSQARFSFCSPDWWTIAGDLLLNQYSLPTMHFAMVYRCHI